MAVFFYHLKIRKLKVGHLVANRNDLDNFYIFIMRNSNDFHFFRNGQSRLYCSENLAVIPHDKICQADRAMGP